MRRAGLLVLGILGGCFTKALWSGSAAPPPKRAGEAECPLDLAVPVAGSRSLSFAVGAPQTAPPKRNRIEMGRGRNVLLLRRPFAFSFVGTDLVEGRTPLPPERITVNFVQTRTEDGTRRDPALLRVQGPVPEAFTARVERCGEPRERRTLDDVEDRNLRIQLGHGADALVALAAARTGTDVVAWYGVDGPGDWQAALREAQGTGSLAPVDPYRVTVRLWCGGTDSWFRLRLSDVVLAANMAFEGGRYTWEGLWVAALELPTGTAARSTGIPSRLHYAEYKQEGKSAGDVAWRALLTPLALAGDFGIAGMEGWLAEDDESIAVTRPRKN
jgi:hypothetical protein